MTLSEIEQDVYRRTGKNMSSPDSATQTRIRAFINQRMRRVLTESGMGLLREDVFTFASEASTPRVALPQGITKLHRVWETTNDRTLRRLDLSTYREDPDPQSGAPDFWVPLGYTAIAKQPSDASAIYAKSTAAGDTQALTFESVLSSGERRTIATNLTGTTAVQLGTLSTHRVIERIYVATAAVGTITIHEDSGSGTELARITLGRTAPRYYSIYLYPTPSSALTYACDATWEIADMSVAGDVPPFPEDFHDLLSIGARMDEYEKTDDSKRFALAEKQWHKRLIDLKWHLHGHQDTQGPSPSRSNLGAWFPAGRW